MTLPDLAGLLRRSWMLLAAATLLGLGLGALWSFARHPTYTASAVDYVSTTSASNLADLNQGSSFAQQVVKSFAAVATTPYVLSPVQQRLHYAGGVAELQSKVTATAATDTTLITIAATDSSATRAAEIANEVSVRLSDAVRHLTPDAGGVTAAVRVTAVQQAAVPSTPTSPKPLQEIPVGGVASLALAVVLLLVRAQFDTTVRNVRDVERAVPLPLLGAIPTSAEIRTAPIVVRDAPSSAVSEAVRSVRANLQFLQYPRERTTLFITSSVQSEGKSTLAVNLAISAQDTGLRVLLIDGDMRRPRAATLLGLDASVGLSNVLSGGTDLTRAIQVWGDTQLHVLPAGQTPPNPSELLESRAMHALLDVTAQDFDLVIIDGPPLLPVSDGAILSRISDGTIVCCALGRVSRTQITASLRRAEQSGGKILGLVPTMSRASDSATYGGAYYDSGTV